jgi:DNA-binding transcriptional ArsR family regulator
MRPREEVILVRALAREGFNISQIARDVGVSRPTVRHWIRRRPKQIAKSACAVCGHERHDFEGIPRREYCYLLGIYLGEGMISAVKNKRCFKLRVFMDSRYPNVITEVVASMTAVMPTSLAGVQPHPRHNVVEIHSYSNA